MQRPKSLSNKNAQKYKTLDDVLRNTRMADTGCLEWLGAINKDGYGACSVGGIFKGQSLHREVFRLATGTQPPVVMHKCDNRKCINPDHLLAGTPQSNVRDMDNKKRRVILVKFSPEQIATIIQRKREKVLERVICEEFSISRGYLWKLMSGKRRSTDANH